MTLVTLFGQKKSYNLFRLSLILLLISWLTVSPFINAQTERTQERDQALGIAERALVNDLKKAVEETQIGNYNEARVIFNRLDSSTWLKSQRSYHREMLEYRALMNKVQSHFSESLEDYLVLLKSYEEANDQVGLAKTHTDLAELYRARNRKENTLFYLKKAEALMNNSAVPHCIKAYWFSRMAAYESQFNSNPNGILSNINQGLALADTDCGLYSKGLMYNELGFMYMHQDFENEALVVDYYQRAINAFQQSNRQRDLVTVKNNLANYYFRREQFDKGLDIISQSIAISEKYQWDTALEDSYFIKMALLDKKGDYKSMFEISMSAYNSKIRLMEFQYGIEAEEIEAKYENELEEQALRDALEENEAKQKALTYSIVIALLFLFIAVASAILFIKIRRKNKYLKAQRETIEQTNFELSNTLAEKDLLYKELNHRVKNNLMVLSGLIYMQENTMTNGRQKELYETLRLRIQAMSIVHEKLYGLAETTDINFQEYLSELVPVLFNSLSKETTDFDYNISCQTLKLNIDQAIPLALIFNELVTNSIKHGFTKKGANFLSVVAKAKDTFCQITYDDSGPGIPPHQDLTNSKSMGLKIIQLMATQLKANLKYGSHTGEAQIIIELPFAKA